MAREIRYMDENMMMMMMIIIITEVSGEFGTPASRTIEVQMVCARFCIL